jgi:hypothetical protein
VESQTRYLFWAKVLGEYRGGGKSVDIHALEATHGILRVAEANLGWDLAMGFLLFFLIVAPAWGGYEIARIFLPSLGPSSGPQSSPGFAFATSVLLVAASIVGLSLSSRRRFGRFVLAGAFVFSRSVYFLEAVQVEAMRTPRAWRLHCHAAGRDLVIVVSAQHDRLRAAIELAGKSLDLQPR